MTLQDEIAHVLNCASAEGDSGTPDFILAHLLVMCLEAFNSTMLLRDNWYGYGNSLDALKSERAPAKTTAYDLYVQIANNNRQAIIDARERVVHQVALPADEVLVAIDEAMRIFSLASEAS